MSVQAIECLLVVVFIAGIGAALLVAHVFFGKEPPLVEKPAKRLAIASPLDEQCPHCRAFMARHLDGPHCYCCGRDITRAVDAVATPEPKDAA